jgi:peptide/nickel transport system substrate-binding protein
VLPFGKLPAVVTDAAKTRKTFGEAPMLAALVKAGKLPPVKERLPEDPMVIKPTEEIGRYGGTWRSVFTGPGDRQNFERITNNSLVRWDARVTQVVPNIVKRWQISDGGKTYTLVLRKGLRWSNGDPLTADDIMFWYEDLNLNQEVTSRPPAWNSVGGKQGVWTKVDDLTVKIAFESPYYTFLEVLSQGGQSALQGGATLTAPFLPSKYLRQFHPKYAGREAVDKLAKDAGYPNWVAHLKFKADPQLNVETPCSAQWCFKRPINETKVVMERNPYYHVVDTAGNQLPYIDRITFELITDLEVVGLRAAAGEYDIQARNINLDKLPVLVQNRPKGNYRIFLYPSRAGSDAAIYFNQTYHAREGADPEIAGLLRNFEFRKAVSLAIDRDQLNEVFWMGVGFPGSVSPDPTGPYSPGPEYRKKYSTLDVKQANRILDGLGYGKKDREGFRLRKDGKGRLDIEILVTASLVDYPKVAEMVADQLARKVGIRLSIKTVERSLENARVNGNDVQLTMWTTTGNDIPFLQNTMFLEDSSNRMGPLYGTWWQTGGKQGLKPEGSMLRLFELLGLMKGAAPDARTAMAKEWNRVAVDQLYAVGTVGLASTVIGVWVVGNNVGNVPQRANYSLPAQTPGHIYPEQFYFKR